MIQRKTIISGGIANVFEWYDYALFTHFAIIIGEQFFPKSNSNTAQLHAFLVFAMGYLMRPLGGMLFGVIGDKFGRKASLSASIICMGIPTTIIGFLPTYQDIGVTASILMVVARMLQGLSMGGALTGSISFIVEHTTRSQRGLFGSIPMAGICIGILLGSTTSYCIKSILTKEQFYSWGWRIPFLIGILIFFIGFYIKKHTEETPLFKKLYNQGKVNKSPLKKVMISYWFDMVVSIFINSTGSIIFYLAAIYMNVYLKSNRQFAESDVDMLINLSYLLMAVTSLFTGWLSDKIKKRKLIFIINLIAIIVSITKILTIIENGSFTEVAYMYIILCIFAATYIGPEPALQAEFYPTEVRNSALSLSYNIATSVFGGMTPYIVAQITIITGSIIPVNFCIIVFSIISLISLFYYIDRSNQNS